LRRPQLILLSLLLLTSSMFAADPDRKALRQDDPEYPEIAVKMSLHGTVKLKIWIAPEGSVRRLEYVGGHPLLAESALKAVRLWKYAVAPKESTQIVEVKF
jgi:TonB family protein